MNNPQTYLDKVNALLDHGIQVGDVIDVLDDCVPDIHFSSQRKCYRINYDCLVDEKRGPRYIIAGIKGLVAFCDVPLKGGTKVKVTKRSQNSCVIEPCTV